MKTLRTFLIILSIPTLLFGQSAQNYFREGSIQKSNGNWAAALNIWTEGYHSLLDEGKTDARIGFAFIETVAEHNLKHFYKIASQMYFAGLRKENFSTYFHDITQEARRLLPLIQEYNNNDTVREWRNLIGNRNSELINKMKEFWILRDPTPTTELNERLLEHWERIVYARKAFTRAQSSIYGGDDRSTYFVKYGKPDKVFGGGFDDQGSTTYSGYGFGNAGQVGEIPLLPSLMQRLEDSDPSLDIDFDIWAYTNLYPGQEESLVFIFARNPGNIYHYVGSFEELLPASRYQGGRGGRKRYINSPFAAVYEYLGFFDNHFYQMHTEISLGAKLTGMIMYGQNDRVKYDAPLEKSVYEDIINKVDIIAFQTRTLDKNNNPQLTVTAMSNPWNMFGDYTLTNTLIIRDADFNELQRIDDAPEPNASNTSVFRFEHTDSTKNYFLAAKAIPRKPDPDVSNFYIGKQGLTKKTPLTSDLSVLEISDMITGIDFPPSVNPEIFPVPILPTNKIVKGDSLKLYFEVYHLFIGPDEKTQYQVTYEIERKVKKGLWAKLTLANRNREVVSETISLETNQSSTKENIKFDISDLKEGEYLFTVKVLDILSGQSKERNGEFIIMK